MKGGKRMSEEKKGEILNEELDEEGKLVIEGIYELSNELKNDAQGRKQHADMKSLSLLQAITILITISQFISSEENNVVFKVFTIIFYIFMIATIVVLLCSLNDSIICNITGNVDDSMQILDSPNEIYSVFIECYKKEGFTVDKHYKALIESNSKCIDSIERLNKVKARFFNLGLVCFIIGLFIEAILAIFKIY